MDSSTLLWIVDTTWRRRWLALAIAAAIMLADAVFTLNSPHSYLARSSLLIGPSSTVDPGQLVYSVDALGRSMIVGTYANVLNTDIIRRQALQSAGVPPEPADSTIQIKASALADSAVVQVTAEAPNPDLAAAIANAVCQAGQLRMSELYPMYDLTVVTQATPPASAYRPDIKRNLSIGALLGLLFAAGSACALEYGTRRRA